MTATRAPGPRSLPVVGGPLQLRGDPLRRLVELRARYGRVVRLGPAGPTTLYLIADPTAIKRVLVDNQRNYKKGRAAQRLRRVLGDGLLLLEGDGWKRHRRLVQPAFHRRKIADLGATFVHAAEELLDRWRPHIDRGSPIDAREEMLRLTMGLTLRNLFKTEPTELRELVDAWQALYDDLSSSRFALVRAPAWFPSSHRRRFEDAQATVRRVLDGMIAERRRRPCDDGSVLSMLLEARDEDGGPGLTDAELRDEVMTLFVGGYETTSNALAFTLAMLAEHPSVAARHRAELDEVLGGRLPTIEDLSRLPFNRQILQEAMRLHPPSWVITREALGPDELGGFAIEPGAQLLLSSYAVHHDPSLWPNPTRFAPERFAPEEVELRPRFAYFPFGGGPRQCLGDQYSLTEMQLILAVLGQRIRLRLAPGTRVEAQAHVGLRPRWPLRLVVEEQTRPLSRQEASFSPALGAQLASRSDQRERVAGATP